jgi:hypothetical protein
MTPVVRTVHELGVTSGFYLSKVAQILIYLPFVILYEVLAVLI